MKTRTTLVAALAVSLGAPAFAQTDHFTPGSERVIPTGSTASTGGGKTFAISGDFTDDQRRDILMIDLDDDEIDMYYDAGLMTAAFPLSESGHDLSWVRPTPTGHQRFVTTSASGLTLYDEYDAGSYTATAISGSVWNGAKRVIACYFDNNNTMDLVGLSSDKLTVIVTTDAFNTSSATETFAIGAVPLDIAVGHWDTDSQMEIFLLFPAGLNVREKRGSTAAGIYFTVDSGSLAVFQQDGYAQDRVAVVYSDSGNEYLKVIDATTTESPVSLAADSYAVAAADVDLDDDDDLFIVSQDADTCTLIINESDGVAPGTSATFTAGSGETIDLFDGSATSNTYQNARPLFEDFDNDGDPDVALYVEELDAMVLQFNDTIVAMGNAPMLYTAGTNEVVIDFGDSENYITELTLEIQPASGSSDGLYWQVWTEVHGTGTLDAAAFAGGYRSIDESTETFVIDLIDDTQEDAVLAAFDRNYYFIVQETVENGSGEIVQVGPPAVIAVSLLEDEIIAIATAASATNNLIQYCYTDEDDNFQGCSTTAITIVVPTDPVYSGPGDPEPLPEDREIGPGGVCVPDLPPVPPDPPMPLP